MKVATAKPSLEVDIEEIKDLLAQAKTRTLTDEESERLLQVALSYLHVTQMLADKDVTIARLRNELFGPSSERTDDVLARNGQNKPEAPAENSEPASTGRDGIDRPAPQADGPRPPRPGHGRNGIDEYEGAERIFCPHGTLKAGDRCPECRRGKLYPLAKPAVLIRVTAGPPLSARAYLAERLRCNLCLVIFTAAFPEGIGNEKYDARAAAMIGLLRYGTGVPFQRLEGLQRDMKIPLPSSTQWEIAAACATKLEPVFHEFLRQAAQGELMHNDDTSMEILEVRRWLETRAAAASDGRTGIFTSCIVARVDGRHIALFFTGRQHAGENLANILRQRAAELPPPMQMCDGLSRNLPKELEVVLSNCLAHARRHIIDVFGSFPSECRHVLESLREVYRFDAEARDHGLSAADRLAYHQAHSGPVMTELKAWLEAQIAERKTEPNSGLGKAIAYMLERWQPLTLFLRQPGASLDNNICERALKRAVLHRKNSYFYKTENGARVGDLFMSLIHTARLCNADPLDYLTELQRHAEEVRRNPSAWLPWNYKTAIPPPEPAN